MKVVEALRERKRARYSKKRKGSNINCTGNYNNSAFNFSGSSFKYSFR